MKEYNGITIIRKTNPTTTESGYYHFFLILANNTNIKITKGNPGEIQRAWDSYL